MDIETVRQFFLWCTIINLAMIYLWAGVFVLGRDWLHRFHGRWFRLREDHFDAIHYTLMGVYKVGILLFCLVPLISLWIIG